MSIFSRRSLEGYLLIDHSDSPGFSEADAKAGHRASLLPFLGNGQQFKAATNTCSHCSRVVVKNPLRTRARGHCPKCDLFICDPCSADFYLTDDCRCFAKRVETHLNAIAKGI